MRLFRYDDPTRKPDLSRLNDQSRFQHPQYQGVLMDYVFNEGGGTTVRDASPSANIGTFSTLNASDWNVGPHGPQLKFGANNERIDCTGISGTFSTMTFLAWVRFDSFTQFDGLIVHRNGSATHGLIIDQSSPKLGYMWNGVRYNWGVGPSLSTGVDYLLGVMVKSGNSRAYYASPSAMHLTGADTATHSAGVFTSGLTDIGQDVAIASRVFDGQYRRAMIIDHDITISEFLQFWEAPYRAFYPTRQWWFVPSAAAPASGHHLHLPLLGVG